MGTNFIESIAIHKRKIPLLAYHQKRMDDTYWDCFHEKNPHSIHDMLHNVPSDQLYKLRIVYNQVIKEVSLIKYKRKPIELLTVVNGGEIEYHYKSADRSALDNLFGLRNGTDDVIISVNGYVTDSSYANLAFFDGKKWYTPETHLLNGVRRQFLLSTDRILPKPIRVSDIPKYQKVSLFNAMMDLGEVEVDCKAIEIPS